MTSWQYFIGISLLLLMASSVIVSGIGLADIGNGLHQDTTNRIAESNAHVEEYNNAIQRKYPYNTILSPLELSYVVLEYEIQRYNIEVLRISNFNTYNVQIVTGTLNSYDMLSAYNHLEFLNSHATNGLATAWVLYKKYRIKYDQLPDGSVANLYFEGVEE